MPVNVNRNPIIEPAADIAALGQLIDGAPHTGWGGVIKAVPLSGGGGSGNEYFLHVLRWELGLNFEEAELPCSNNLGASDGRRVGYSNDWAAEILINVAYPADVILRGLFGVQLFFFLGKVTPASGNPGLLDQFNGGVIQDRAYVCPLAAITKHGPKQLVNEHKFVRTTVIGKTRGHLLLVPDQGTPGNVNTVVGAYFKFYQNKLRTYIQQGVALDTNMNAHP